MYNSIRVRNYRCFRDVELRSLKRVNLIVGQNGVGKTSLLEAMWLHHGFHNPELPVRVAAFRRLSQLPLASLGDDLFRAFDTSEPILLSSVSCTESGVCVHEHVRIHITERPVGLFGTGELTASEVDLSLLDDAQQTEPSIEREIVIEHSEGDGAYEVTGRAMVTQDGKLAYERRSNVKRPTAIYMGALQEHTEKLLAARLTRLVQRRDIEEVTGVLAVLEPRLTDIRLLYEADTPRIFADIGLPRMIPFALLGGGVYRLLSILLAVPEAENGLLLIDEIENGVYHSALARLWEHLSRFAGLYNVQIVATTHSLEAVQALHSVMIESTDYGFAAHRLERVDDDIVAIALDRDSLSAALEMGWELR